MPGADAIGTAHAMPVEPDFTLHPSPSQACAAADALFAEIANVLRPLLPTSADIRHVGATSVPGCLTKGDLDIVVRVTAADFAAADKALAACFGRNPGSARTDTFSAFEDAGQVPHLGVQLVVVGSPFDVFHLLAEALRSDGELLARYNALKSRFDGRPMIEYRAAKDAFIAEALRKLSP